METNDFKYSFEEIRDIIERVPFSKRTFCGILKGKYQKWVGFEWILPGNHTLVELDSLIDLAANFWYFRQEEFEKRFNLD